MEQPLVIKELSETLAEFSVEQQKQLLCIALKLKEKYKKEAKNKKLVNYVPTVDKSAPKYKICLNLVNKMLENMGRERITDLTEFKEISREDLGKEANKKTIEDMADELFVFFNRYSFAWYRRNGIKNYSLIFLKNVCKDLGLKLITLNKHRQKNRIANYIKLYSIINYI